MNSASFAITVLPPIACRDSVVRRGASSPRHQSGDQAADGLRHALLSICHSEHLVPPPTRDQLSFGLW